MTAILGIDAAWTPTQPSGVALVESAGGGWRVVRVAPSCASFLESAKTGATDWGAKRYPGSRPDLAALLAAARELTDSTVDLVALDLPLARAPFASRRPSDTAVSKAFGRYGCSTHSPTAARPGATATAWMEQLDAEGFPLATNRSTERRPPCSLEVYPHPALLALLELDFRLPYKVARSGRYWPGKSRPYRIARLLDRFAEIDAALSARLGPTGLPLPDASDVSTLSWLKRFEDGLDSLVCAWVGTTFLDGAATAYGDEDSAIWVPQP